jgi:hypothetical protein
MTHTEARELANKFGSRMCDENGDTHNQELYCFDLDDIIALKEALAQPEQEPVACKPLCELCVKRGYTFCANAVKTTPIHPPPQPERHELQAKGEHPAPCARHCEANAFQIVIKNLKAQLAQPEQEPVAHPVISGALFDFMGWLTSRKERIVLSSADEASLAVDAIRDFAKMRGLSLDDAKVQDWNTTPPQRTWVGLTDEEIKTTLSQLYCDLNQIKLAPNDRPQKETVGFLFARAIEAKLKEKNT